MFDSCAGVNRLEGEASHYVDSCAGINRLEGEAGHYFGFVCWSV